MCVARGGKPGDRAGPERRCIATGAVRPISGLVRFVVDPDGRILADIAGKLPGRGVWVSADRIALETAVDKRLFSRAAGRHVWIPDGFTEEVEALMVARAVGFVSLARKAGQAVAGYDRVRSWLVRGDAKVLVQASDGSARGRSKLRPPAGKDSYVGVLTANELGLAFGRENVIHCALAGGGLAKRVVGEARRLSGMRQWIGETPGKGEKTV